MKESLHGESINFVALKYFDLEPTQNDTGRTGINRGTPEDIFALPSRINPAIRLIF